MAIVGGDDELENPNNQQGANSAGGGSYAGDGGSAAATTKAASPDATSSGGYTNLTSYLQANQAGAATTGKAVENVVDQTGRDATAANATFGANGASEPHGAKLDQNALNLVKDGAGTGAGGTSVATPNATASAYSGPNDATGVTGYDASQKAMSKLGDNLGRADGSMGGTSALLKQAYQQPNYSQGENSLDSFLVGGSRNDQGNTATQQATKDWQGQGDSYKALLAQVNGGIDAAKGQTAAVQKQYDDAHAAAVDQTDKNNAGWIATDKAQKAAAAAAVVKAQNEAKAKAVKDAATAKAAADAKAAQDQAAAQKQQAAAQAAVAASASNVINNATPTAVAQNAILTANDNINQTIANAPAAVAGEASHAADVISHPKKWHPHLAFGGEIPSYSKLMDQLQKKKGK